MRLSKEKVDVQPTRKAASSKLDTYIGDGTVFEGNLVSKNNLSIYGSVKGTIECQGRVVVGESGDVAADITANDVTVSGKIVGNVTAKARLEISPSGALQGDIKTSRLVMQDGAKFDGRSEMISNAKPGIEKVKADKPTPALAGAEKPKLPQGRK